MDMPENWDTLQPLADHVWLFPCAKNSRLVEPNVGVIVTSIGTVLVDSGNSPHHGYRILSAIEQLQLPPVQYVIYTHHHWDHTFGAQVYNVPVIAHVMTDAFMQQRAAVAWSTAFTTEAAAQNRANVYYADIERAVRGKWDNFRIVTPSMTFTHDLTLYCGDVVIEMTHVGGQHSADSIVVKCGNVAFVGDSYYPPPPSAQSVVRTYDRGVIARVLEDAALELFVDGHTAPRSRAQVADLPQG